MPLEPSPRSKKPIPAGVWTKCDKCEQIIYNKELEENFKVCPKCGAHFRLSARERIAMLFDPKTFEEFGEDILPTDALGFVDIQPYSARLLQSQKKTGQKDACIAGQGPIEGHPVAAALLDFDFMGGSLGMAAGEAVIKGLETAAQKGTPFIMFAASGGARMQEGILSLMQLPRTTVAVEMLREAHQPYIVVLTNPTTGGVTASYAMLGDVHIAEPGALICFAGPRVIEQTIREKLPEGFQRAEYLKEHGIVDMVVHRHELRGTLARLCRLLCKAPASEVAAPAHEALPAPAETPVPAAAVT